MSATRNRPVRRSNQLKTIKMKNETIDYKGYQIETFYDEDAQSPQEWDNSENFLVYDHRSFYVKVDGFDAEEIYEAYTEGKKLFKGCYFFPVFAYIHSGVRLKLQRYFPGLAQGHNEFDVSFKGFALVKKQKGTWTREQAYKRAEGNIETWNTYLSGDVYGYKSEAGSCWGFYGSEGYAEMIEEAKGEIDYEIEKKTKEHGQQVKAYIKNHVPLDKRIALTV